MPPDTLEVYAGFSSLQRGMNGGTLNTLIHEQQFSKGINVTCRNGLTGTRPPVIEIDMQGSESVLNNIRNGKFQGMYYYQYEDNNYMAFGMSGSVYLIDPIANTIWDMTAVIANMSSTVDRLHFCQVERYLIVQDGTNVPMVIEDTASRKAVQGAPDSEIPTGTIMAYVHGRLFIKTTQYGFIAGNIHTPNAAGAVLIFTETEYLAGGGALFIPTDMGQISGLSWAQAYGEATGEGPLLALCDRGIAAFQVNVPRLNWQDMPIMRIEPAGNGNASEYAIVRMNEDLLFMSWNGIQDYALLSVEAATHHRMTNLNTEVQPFVDLEDVPLRRFVSATKFDDRFLYTAIGEAVKTPGGVTDYRYEGLISLDFSPVNGISSIGQSIRPAYDGIWTGFHPMGLQSGLFSHEEMCFVFGKDDDGINHLYRLHKEQGHDTTIADGEVKIPCRLYTKGYGFTAFDRENPRPVPHFEKELKDVSLWIHSFREDIDFTLHVCPDFTTVFHPISQIRINAPMLTDATPPVAGGPQARPKEMFPGLQKNHCEPISGKDSTLGYEIQFMVEWSGIANIGRLMIAADARRNVVKMACAGNTKVLTGTAPDDFLYDLNDQD